MRLASFLLSVGLAAGAVIGGGGGGDTTVVDSSRDAFGQPAANLPTEDLRRFAFGNRLFRTAWVVAPSTVQSLDGLGPLYNRRSCSGCHVRDGRGRPPANADDPLSSMLVRIVPADPLYGSQLQDRSIPGVEPEGKPRLAMVRERLIFEDGSSFTLVRPRLTVSELGYGPMSDTVVLSPRVAPAIHGSGLLETVPDARLLELADPDDRDGDGISGRPRRLGKRIGRLGWKSGQPDVRGQIVAALARDVGITSRDRPHDDSTSGQRLGDRPDGGSPEIDEPDLARLVFYVQTLAVPARRDRDDPRVRHGEGLFARIGCTDCHRPTMHTGEHPDIPQLSNQTIHPYTDLLLHDMGPGLSDGTTEGDVSGSEWRTPPLWGIGLVRTVNGHTFFLHDGRARDLGEAILWHGGEAARARRAFTGLPASDRQALAAFLESL